MPLYLQRALIEPPNPYPATSLFLHRAIPLKDCFQLRYLDAVSALFLTRISPRAFIIQPCIRRVPESSDNEQRLVLAPHTRL